MFLVEIEHLVVIHGIDVVTGQDKDIVVTDHIDEIQILINGIGCAAIPIRTAVALIRRQNIGTAPVGVEIPRAAVPDVPIQFERLILGQDSDRIDARVTAVAQGEIDDAVFSSEQEARLGLVFGQDAKSAPLSTSQDHSQAIRFFHKSAS